MRHERAGRITEHPLGFERVFRYTAGKVDWMAAGLPIDGTKASVPRVGDMARRDVPTCRLEEPAVVGLSRMQASDWDLCVVVNESNIVLGRVTLKALGTDPKGTAEEVMEPGPVTYRPHEIAEEAARKLAERHVESVLVTTADGELIGLFRAEDVLSVHRASSVR